MTDDARQLIRDNLAMVEKAGYGEAALLFLESHRPLWRAASNVLAFLSPFGLLVPGFESLREIVSDESKLNYATKLLEGRDDDQYSDGQS